MIFIYICPSLTILRLFLRLFYDINSLYSITIPIPAIALLTLSSHYPSTVRIGRRPFLTVSSMPSSGYLYRLSSFFTIMRIFALASSRFSQSMVLFFLSISVSSLINATSSSLLWLLYHRAGGKATKHGAIYRKMKGV